MTATAPSLRRRLLKWLVLPVLLVNLGGAVVSYQFARKPAFSALDGDLTGWSQFVVQPAGEGSLLRYDQEARVTKPGAASRFAGAARPLLVANHRSMMRTGLRALVRRAG